MVARVRACVGLSQAELYLGVSPMLISALESGHRRLSADVRVSGAATAPAEALKLYPQPP